MISRNSKWNGILLSMTKIPSDDILEGLYKLRIRESEKLKTVLALYDLEIHQKKAGLDYHRLKTMVKRSTKQNIRIKNFEARNGNYERNAVVNSDNKELQEIVGSGKPTGSVRKETIVVSVTILINVQKQHSRIRLQILSCSRVREMRREPEVPEARVPVEECFDGPCKDYLKGTCTNSFCEKWHPPECLYYKSEKDADLGKSALMHMARLKNSPAKGLKRMVTKVQRLC